MCETAAVPSGDEATNDHARFGTCKISGRLSPSGALTHTCNDCTGQQVARLVLLHWQRP